MLLIRAKFVLPIVAPPIEDGCVVVDGAQIVAAGTFEKMRTEFTGEVIELGDSILLPGLVNAHCHLDYTLLRYAISPQRSFTEWIRAINAHKRGLHDDDYRHSIQRGFAECRKWGTTTVANIESFPELIPTMPPPPLRTWWFLEMIDIRNRVSTEDAIAGALAFFDAPPPGWLGGFGLSPHAPYTASGPLFELAGQAAAQLGLPVTTHVAESREEWDMFREGRGELYDFMLKLGRWMYDCHHARTPFAHVARHADFASAPWLLAHMNELDESDLAHLAALPTRPAVVHCPGSHRYFRHAPFPIRGLLAAGVRICLGTDSLASTGSLSMFEEMRTLAATEPWLSDEHILRMATLHGADALGFNGGKIAPAAAADLIAIPATGTAEEIHAAVLAHREPIRWMMLNGHVLPA